MASKDLRLRITFLLILLGVLASVPALAGSAVIGRVAGSTNATLRGQALLDNTTIFSGDSLQVKDGVALVAVGNTSRMVFGRETVASFLRDANDVTVLLGQGNISLYHPDDGATLRVKVGDISIAPGKGFKTVGDVAMLNGAVVVTAKEGLLRVEGNGAPVDVAKGKTITLTPKAARAPRPAGGMSLNGVNGVEAGTLVAAGVGAVFGIVATKRAGDARDAANQADADAIAAGAASKTNAQAAADKVGCALNLFSKKSRPTDPSPYTPFTGTC